MADAFDPAHLSHIDKALADQRWMPAIPAALRADYHSAWDAQGRAGNRRILLLFTILFDLFWFAQWQMARDILVQSAWLRLGLFTPCAGLFLVLDHRGRLRRSYEPAMLVLAVTPAVITAWLCLSTTQMLAQPEIYGTPIILLYTGVLLRLQMPSVLINAALCSLVYVGGIVICPMLPQGELSTLIFVQLVFAAAVVIFNMQLETRDRRVFLLTRNEQIRRALVAAQNSGLLRDTQTDALTGLANRRCFDETISARWLEALEKTASIGLLMIDVDHFKVFNDHYGHTVGDDCLRRVAAQLAAAARRGDVVARYGGEEFAVIMSDVTLEEVVFVAERMRLAVAGLALPHDGLPPGAVVTISLGCAAIRPDDAQGLRRLIEAADRHLYTAKRSGRNRLACDFDLRGAIASLRDRSMIG